MTTGYETVSPSGAGGDASDRGGQEPNASGRAAMEEARALWWPARPRSRLVASLMIRLSRMPTRADNRRMNRVDVAWQRSFGRTLSSVIAGIPMLLLTTTGRRTGLARTVALAYVVLDGEIFVVGGAWGADRHPLWFENLLVTPAVEVELGRSRHRGRARPVEEPERSLLWPRLVAATPSVELYSARTERRVPVVRVALEG